MTMLGVSRQAVSCLMVLTMSFISVTTALNCYACATTSKTGDCKGLKQPCLVESKFCFSSTGTIAGAYVRQKGCFTTEHEQAFGLKKEGKCQSVKLEEAKTESEVCICKGELCNSATNHSQFGIATLGMILLVHWYRSI